jgi:hypothetical protein
MKNACANRFFYLAVFFLLSLFACNSTKPAPGIDLTFNLKKGKTYDYQMTWDMNQEMMGQTSKVHLSTGYSLVVTEDDGKIKTLSTTYSKIAMSINIGGREMNIDTESPPIDSTLDATGMNDLLRRVFASMQGRSFTMKVNRQGEVVEVSGVEALVHAITDSLSAGKDPSQKQQMESALASQFSDENIKSQFNPVFNIFPGKPVKLGDSWEKSFVTSGTMAAKYATRYEVKKIEGSVVTLNAKTKISSELSNGNIDGDQNTILQIDSKTGLVVHSTYDQRIITTANQMTLTMTGSGIVEGKERE